MLNYLYTAVLRISSNLEVCFDILTLQTLEQWIKKLMWSSKHNLSSIISEIILSTLPIIFRSDNVPTWVKLTKSPILSRKSLNILAL